jgi:hypothetical protein
VTATQMVRRVRAATPVHGIVRRERHCPQSLAHKSRQALLPTNLGCSQDLLSLAQVGHRLGATLPSSPLWGGVGGGGVCENLSAYGANTPTLALPTRGREPIVPPDRAAVWIPFPSAPLRPGMTLV